MVLRQIIVVAGLAAVMVVSLLWWIGSSWSSSRKDQASYLLYQAVERLVARLFQLLENINIPTKLRDYGVTEADIPSLVEGGMKLSRLFVPNPRNLTEDDVREIFTKAL